MLTSSAISDTLAPSAIAATRAAATPARSGSKNFTHWVTDPVAATVPQVRARVRAALEGWRVSPDEADVLLLAVSELVANVVRHAGAGRMRVGVASGGGWLRLEVADQGAALPRLPAPSAVVDPDSESGRGLLLVQLLAADLGGDLALTVDEFGKAVRVRIPASRIPPPGTCAETS
ncbi:ATP-binding protein [Streptomyces sp. ISL-94]|uniref:ATP-binding protein n=1 Tax=Streptomyces sp. ISL-94 TaxID=2819190 RepID=UPI001BEA58C9|nr:ATP-binding protein [Streptomyces sp. ISL-94]MBT2480634.1 ATP-binding protein [Streptomyces sp. ISL-94]